MVCVEENLDPHTDKILNIMNTNASELKDNIRKLRNNANNLTIRSTIFKITKKKQSKYRFSHGSLLPGHYGRVRGSA